MTTKTLAPKAPAAPMTQAAAARIQSAAAKADGVSKASFAARAQRAAVKGGKR